jgi:hypothetical protein
MTNPENKFPPEAHKPYCIEPKIKPRYEKGYNNEGKRTWDVVSLKCVGCGAIYELPHIPSLTKKQREKLAKNMPKLPKIVSENELDLHINEEDIDNEYLYTEGNLQTRIKDVQPVINRQEKKLRRHVKELNGVYKKDEKDCPRLKGRIGWDPKLLERFLDCRPPLDVMRKLLLWPPLLRYNRKRGDKTRGWIPDPDNWGHIKVDEDCYNMRMIYWRYKLYGETPPDPDSIDLNKLSPFEKLVIEEAKGRKKYMQSVIKKYNESQPQIYYTTDEIIIKNRKKKKPIP